MNKEYKATFEQLKSLTFVQNAIEKYGEDLVQSFFDRAWSRGHSDGDFAIKQELVEIIDIANLVANK